MKKVLLSLAVVATMAMTSCQPSATKAEDEGAALKAKIENCQDPDSLKIYVQQAKEYADKLVANGDDEAAKAYLDELIPTIQAKDPSAASIFDVLKATADSTLNNAVNAAGEAVSNATDAAKDAANEAVNEGKQKVNDAVNEGKKKVNDAVNEGKQKANEAINEGKGKANEAVNDAKEKAAKSVQKSADRFKDMLNK